jgi:hypothetical protein
MRNLILSLGVLCAASGMARAEGCFGPGTPLFHCTVKGGSTSVDLCLQGDVAYYRFGPTDGAAEMILAQPVHGVSMRPWNGIGRTILEEAQFNNGAYAYTVHYAIDRIPEGGEVKVTVSGGVTVIKGDQTLARLTCDAGSILVRDIYPLYEAKQAAGQCWNRDRFEWGPC